ncbi:MAG: type II secretion system protein [Burkholderiales bacterium]
MSLIELVVFIVIVSVSIVGIFSVLNLATRTSADPVTRKQALAIAESLLEEIELMPFTFCESTDANAATATGAFVGAGGCATTVEAIGPEASETRYSSTTPFDNVNDYHGFAMNSGTGGIKDIAWPTTPVYSALNFYSASVTVVQEALGSIAASESLRVTVTVTGPGNTTVTLDGYRARYSPNATQ